MKTNYQLGHLVTSEFNLDKANSETLFINDRNETISVDKFENKIVYFEIPTSKYPYKMNVKRTEEEFRKQFKLILVEDFYKDLSFENVIDIVREKDDREKFVKHLSGFLSPCDIDDLMKIYVEDNRTDFDDLVEYMQETIELNTDKKIIQIDTLEKEYLFEEFSEKLKNF